ncbi:MAG TPA: type II toxin-antitoxin system VapC family toxin [Gemmataceae bacterium]|nr:type II toxin-antitoxin system VapC family toxin [Gemmataceae bacterium]
MKLLLDTHTFLWLVEGDPKLTSTAKAALADPANDLGLSAASVWELAIKIGNKKLTLKDPLAVFVSKWTPIYQIALLPVETPHAVAVGDLPLHHRDPFDRMLIAQALAGALTVVTGDPKFAPYSVPIIW